MREKTFLSPSVCLAFLSCLAHFPPADTYESRGDAKDVSCGTLEFLSKYKIQWVCVNSEMLCATQSSCCLSLARHWNGVDSKTIRKSYVGSLYKRTPSLNERSGLIGKWRYIIWNCERTLKIMTTHESPRRCFRASWVLAFIGSHSRLLPLKNGLFL